MFVSKHEMDVPRLASTRSSGAGAEITCSVDGGYGLLHKSGERPPRSEVQTGESTKS